MSNKRLKKLEIREPNKILEDFGTNVDFLLNIYDTGSNNNVSLKISKSDRIPYNEYIIKCLDNEIKNQKKIMECVNRIIKNPDKNPLTNSEIGRKIKPLKNEKLIHEIKHINDNLKTSVKEKKSYKINSITFGILESINKISNDLKKYQQKTFENISEYIQWEINEIINLQEREIVDIITESKGKLVVFVSFRIKCTKRHCIKESCINFFLNIIKDFNYEYFIDDLKIKDINLEKIVKENYTECVILLRIKKKEGEN